ncbi:diguanylate cyclase/phosphodiesterase (GGDEF & EAL domains) with PAS/PAC sensor(s) [Rhodovulum sp. P5]|uniref:putative bifunctional diguanylate cyclase/phosphodiesterase n=1 Tax=Rhodovulum sp. P5 TaxID=1564506 RepID=UPI0009C1B659|nr:EAL domain-containing protein [Rhodovulum sp. P5]ARE39572.1 diguanylate cyclase/phosphodiesterase (GGDEF & EAL domains) with PAS/PAC sensor(s) [Rhodovulum sp. P5]
MHELVRSTLSSLRSALTKHPTPEDAASIVNGTSVGAFVTALNAVVYSIGAFEKDGIPFLSVWLPVIFLLCVALARMSQKAASRTITRVSRKGARKLVQTSVALALPWAALSVYVIGFHGSGEPMIVLLVCSGMLSGGAFMLYRAFVATVSYMVTILIAVVLSFQFGDWENAWSVTVYTTVYSGFLAYFAYSAGETARQRDDSVRALSTAVENLKEARDENYHLANIDDTTNLLNRKAFNERLRDMVAQQQETGRPFSVLLMDLDRFKNVNDLFGHGVGDELLAEVARRLRKSLPENDTVGRLGGDEFGMILTDVFQEHAIATIANRLLATLNQPAHLAGRHLHPGASIGAVICPDDAAAPVELMMKADLALNRAKETGRGQCVKFDDHLRQQVIANDKIEAGLRAALESNLIYVQYQPQISLTDGRLIGAEALVRWKTEEGYKIPPERFLSIAAERGLLPTLSRYIAEAVANDILTWRASGLAPGKVALNIHPDDIKSPELLMETIDMFEARGITGRDLALEITEGCLIGRGTDAVTMILDGLADRGYDLSLDDFGTGHASLAHLKKIPVAEIKIDRSFISGIAVRRDDRAIVAAIAEIARGMGIRSVAEGVEDKAQREILRDLGVDVGQGYLWSRPVGAERFAAYLCRRKRRSG